VSDDRHRCPWPGCERRVGFELWGCAPHWYRIPKPLRDELWRAWRAGTMDEHARASANIDRWIAEHAG
jgi:hypothetical protein